MAADVARRLAMAAALIGLSACASVRGAYETMRDDFGLRRDTSTFVQGVPDGEDGRTPCR